MKRLSLGNLALVSEIISSIAVVMSLLILAVQIRENTRVLRGQQHFATNQLLSQISLMFAENEGLAAISVKARSGVGALNDVERRRFDAALGHVFSTWEYAYYQHANGALDSEVWVGLTADMRAAFVDSQGVVESWRSARGSFGPAFRQYVDQGLLGEPSVP